MSLIHIPKNWQISENRATPEHAYLNRRRFLRKIGLTGLGVLAGSTLACGSDSGGNPSPTGPADSSPAPTYDPGRPLTSEQVAASYNNFYEFSFGKQGIGRLAENFQTRPWQVEVGGLVENPKVYDIDDLIGGMPLEERVYRFRCVEAWAMTVPWTGFPFKALIDAAKPLSSARYVRLLTFLDPDQAPGQQPQSRLPWPYFEGLTLQEAANELTLLATGIYGHQLPVQHGAPIRLVVPWKYGFKSIKSIVSIEFVAEQPPTFWNELQSSEYDFRANVDPAVPHPRWSQATERLIGTDERVPTLPYNGYGEQVAHLYG